MMIIDCYVDRIGVYVMGRYYECRPWEFFDGLAG